MATLTPQCPLPILNIISYFEFQLGRDDDLNNYSNEEMAIRIRHLGSRWTQDREIEREKIFILSAANVDLVL